ncbi:MAG: radical SAM protein [Flavobacteriaceae bacterium]|nr:radical SAM protein [Flavobacteriaceae bacterium]
MSIKTLLITPPFTQLNTPYPATAYLKGFLEEKGVLVEQCDLSIELFSKVFTTDFISKVFQEADHHKSYEYPLVWQQREEYIHKVETVISYLQHQEVTQAYQVLHQGFLPQAHRALNIEEDLSWAFGNLGILDKAKHYATIFVEELGDFIQANVDEFFSFTRYAEQIATSASSFNGIEEFLQYDPTIIEKELLKLLEEKLKIYQPKLLCFSIPFPGNLFAALRCAQFIKQHYPKIKIAFGGGYCNTELRSLEDSRVFKYVDFICLDDGEAPLLRITEYLSGTIGESELERTYILENSRVVYKNKLPNTIFHHKNLPAPSYLGLPLDKYLSFLDVMNPMHRLWSDGKWNKLTISHGCYWKQCTFCDVNLDYIGNYQNTTADDLVAKIQKIVAETGTTGFHFVDEAAPPKMLRALAEKLIEKRVYITWWTNIRFEKTFNLELCSLLAKSGCIAVTGGLEVASDRLLKKMKKGVDIAQVARVTNAFSQHGVMVHAYLMYGFPTQTDRETIDSLEVVRQLFESNCIQSAFWHQFTTTVHSPIGVNPEEFDIEITGPAFEGFAQNDLWHNDPKGADHTKYKTGLNLALHNYLNGVGYDMDLQEWFDFDITPTIHPYNLIEEFL